MVTSLNPQQSSCQKEKINEVVVELKRLGDNLDALMDTFGCLQDRLLYVLKPSAPREGCEGAVAKESFPVPVHTDMQHLRVKINSLHDMIQDTLDRIII